MGNAAVAPETTNTDSTIHLKQRFIVRAVGFLMLALPLWLAFLSFPAYTGASDLDGSWQNGMGHLLKQRSQAGVDYLFPSGPLGYFFTRAYDRDLFAAKIIWEVGLKFVFAVILLRFIYRVPNRWARIACYGLPLLLAPQILHIIDALYILVILLAGLLCLERERWSPSLVFGATLLLATLALVKFSYFL